MGKVNIKALMEQNERLQLSTHTGVHLNKPKMGLRGDF